MERDASRPGSRDASRDVGPDTSRAAAADASRTCAWCEGPIPSRARRDAVCCSVRCRQARHRFTVGAGRAALPVAGGHALRLAYADPPYPGKSRLYRDHPDYAGEVDHVALIRRLQLEYDGWALSTSAAALPAVLALCPPGVRVAAWHRGERPTPSRWPLNAWEPVIYSGGRSADPSRPGPDTTGRFAHLRGIPADHASRPRDRRQAGRVLPMGVRTTRRRAGRCARGPVPGIGRRGPCMAGLCVAAAGTRRIGLTPGSARACGG